MWNNRQKTVILALLIGVAAVAQPSKDAQIKQIRKAYADAKAQIAQNGKNGMAPLDLTITWNDGTQVDEDFTINEEQELTFYFNKHRINSELDYPDASVCYFIVAKWSANGHSSYREILLDPNERLRVGESQRAGDRRSGIRRPGMGTLLFSFTKSETHAGYVTESRYYYDAQGHVFEQKQKTGGKEVKPGDVEWDESDGDKASVTDLLDLFDWLMNPGHEIAEPSWPVEKTVPKAERLKTIRSAYATAKAKVAKNDKADIRKDVQIVILWALISTMSTSLLPRAITSSSPILMPKRRASSMSGATISMRTAGASRQRPTVTRKMAARPTKTVYAS